MNIETHKPTIMKKIFLLFCLFAIVANSYGQLIINHNHRDITRLSESEINVAKSKLHIAYGHTSHGSQITTGMAGLIDFANHGGKGLNLATDIFEWNNGGNNGALDLHDYAMGGDVGYFPSWYNNTVSYLNNTANADVNVIMWSWCGQVDDKYSSGTLFSDYFEPMALLEATYPTVKFVYMTGHLDHWDDDNNKAANDSIRRYCLREEKILYDFADIESYDPDGRYYEFAHDDCSYYNSTGTFLGNWASEWRATHVEDIDWYSCSAAHSDALNANQKAYAAWHLFVEIAKIIVGEEIPDDLAVNDTIIENGESACFDAYNNITVEGVSSTVEFKNGSSVNLIAQNSITFLPGFHAESGSYVHAYISDVFCNDILAPIMATQPIVEKSTESFVYEKMEDQITDQLSIRVFPNPNEGKFMIELNNFVSEVQIIVYNSAGSVVQQSITSENQTTIDISNSKRGIYFVRTSSEDRQFVKKIFIQ